jgi:hypothetical protein
MVDGRHCLQLNAVIRSITGASWRVARYAMRLSELFRASGASSALVKMAARTSAVSPSRDRACRMGDVQKGDPNTQIVRQHQHDPLRPRIPPVDTTRTGR